MARKLFPNRIQKPLWPPEETKKAMSEKQINKQDSGFTARRWREIVTCVFLLFIAGYLFSSCSSSPETVQETPKTTLPSSTDIVNAMAQDMEGRDLSKFTHDSPQHNRLPCLYCHVRNDDSPKPKRAGHAQCASCHVQQFEDKTNAMCTICHTNTESGEIKEFPQLASFNVQFDHASHMQQTNCATCHQTERAGGMTIPSGADAHSSCFQCHTPDKVVAEKKIGSCSTCHQPGTPQRIVDSVATIGFSFDHQNHSRVSCESCHNNASGNKMTAINVGMHSGSVNNCATCHNGNKAFGANTFRDCRQCHQEVAGAKSFGVPFDHADHAKTNCATCHKPTSANFSIPNGQNAHNTCFQCHSPNKPGPTFTSSKCFSCHQVNGSNDITAASVTIDGNFTHTKHKSFNCATCHESSKGVMAAPTVAMHKETKATQTCATCHNGQKAFGGDNFTNCKLCHTTGNFKF